jgi:hypothetical protein
MSEPGTVLLISILESVVPEGIQASPELDHGANELNHDKIQFRLLPRSTVKGSRLCCGLQNHRPSLGHGPRKRALRENAARSQTDLTKLAKISEQ